jgi:hypothetical protein
MLPAFISREPLANITKECSRPFLFQILHDADFYAGIAENKARFAAISIPTPLPMTREDIWKQLGKHRRKQPEVCYLLSSQGSRWLTSQRRNPPPPASSASASLMTFPSLFLLPRAFACPASPAPRLPPSEPRSAPPPSLASASVTTSSFLPASAFACVRV